MWYAIAAAGFAVLIVAVCAIFRARRANHLIAAIVNGAATDQPGKAFVEWLNETPSRVKQKDMFLQVMTRMGASQAQSVECLIRSICNAWKPDGRPLGELLAIQIEQNLTFDESPETGERGRRPAGEDALSAIKTRLLALDAL